MPERIVTDLTQATLKFAAGDDQSREQVSSTWYVRFTRAFEVYILNRHAGGNRAHISFHKDGYCHYKVEDPSGGGRVLEKWEMPEPMAEGLLRLAAVTIPHRGLVKPVGLEQAEDDTVLIPPPLEDHQIEVDILAEFGRVRMKEWPGQTGDPRTSLVGRFSLYSESPEDGFVHLTVVSSIRQESLSARRLSEMPVKVTDGVVLPGPLRTVLFEMVEVDGQQLPVLTEMPIGHMAIRS